MFSHDQCKVSWNILIWQEILSKAMQRNILVMKGNKNV